VDLEYRKYMAGCAQSDNVSMVGETLLAKDTVWAKSVE
jgi:hypothetical protein